MTGSRPQGRRDGDDGPAGRAGAGPNPPMDYEAPVLGESTVAEHGFELGGKPSGLRNPSRSMRALGATTLILEALVLVLLLAPLRMVQTGGVTPVQVTVIVVAAVSAGLITGLLGSRWGWWLGSALQVALIAGGFLHWTIAAIGVVFGLAWLYVLYVRKQVLM